jgi:hypothetical protein
VIRPGEHKGHKEAALRGFFIVFFVIFVVEKFALDNRRRTTEVRER